MMFWKLVFWLSSSIDKICTKWQKCRSFMCACDCIWAGVVILCECWCVKGAVGNQCGPAPSLLGLQHYFENLKVANSHVTTTACLLWNVLYMCQICSKYETWLSRDYVQLRHWSDGATPVELLTQMLQLCIVSVYCWWPYCFLWLKQM